MADKKPDTPSDEEILQNDKFSILRATKNIMRATMALGLAMTVAIIAISSIQVTHMSLKQYNWHIRCAAWAGVSAVNADKVTQWLATDKADGSWDFTDKLLSRMVRDFGLDYAYVCVVDPPDYTHITYLFNPVDEKQGFKPYPLGYEQDYINKKYNEGTRKVFEQGKPVVRYVMRDTSGAHITANAPVRDSHGRIVAMVGVRKSMMDFIRLRRGYLVRINIVMVALAAMFVLAATIMFKRIVIGPVAVHSVRLRMAMEEAQSADRAKSRFLATMSHEIRTPMNAIVGFSELSLRDDAPPPVRERLERINRAARALLAIINDILDYSKIESGRIELVPVDYSLDALLEDVSSILRVRLPGSFVHLVVERDPLVPQYLFGDDARLRQVLINLGGNAAKFTERGEIRLAVSLNHDSPLGDEGGEVLLDWSVKDTGIGIKEEDIGKLFGAFSQVNVEQNRGKEGTGLGLAISRQLVHLMGGEINVNSTYGKGSEFYFTIPQKVGHQVSEDAAQKDDEVFACPSAHVLVVDDNDVNLLVARGYLAPYECSVTTVTDGMSAVKAAREQTFDIIFMDHMMPGMDGEEAATAIRERESVTGRHECIVALTADVSSDAMEVFRSKGFDDYLGKPIEYQELSRVMREHIPSEKIIAAPLANEATSSAIGTAVNSAVTPAVAPAVDHAVDPAVLRLFLRQVPKKAELIEQFARDALSCGTGAENDGGEHDGKEALKRYQIEVHALKSSAEVCGFDEVSALAAQAEKAAKDGDTPYIKEHNGELLQKYRDLTAAATAAIDVSNSPNTDNSAKTIAPLADDVPATDGTPGDSTPASPDFPALLDSMRKAAAVGDIVTLEDGVAGLTSVLRQLQAACDDMDTEKAAAILGG